MRSFLTLIICLCCWCAPAKDLLLLIDSEVGSKLGPVLPEWETQVRSEGWRITERYFPRWRGSYATNDWRLLNILSNWVSSGTWDAVQVLGHAAPLMSGSANPDGHEARRQVTHQWLACSNLVFTDSTTWSMPGTVAGLPSLIGTNVPGDGIPDQTGGTFARPVSVLDAAGLTASSGTFATGYLAGQQAQVDVDEGPALRRYFTNNLAYRRGLISYPVTGLVRSDSWFNYSTVISSNTAATLTAGSSSFAGLTNQWIYHASYSGTLCPDFVTDTGTWTRTLVAVVYKSYCMEDASGLGFYRRLLFPGVSDAPIALVSGWAQGNNSAQFFWLAKASDATVADAIRSSWARYGAVDFSFPIAGDLTLPLGTRQSPAMSVVMGQLSVPAISAP